MASLHPLSYFKNMYEYEDKHFYHTTLSQLLSLYIKHGGGKILDAGCGTGRFLIELDKYGISYGTDVSKDALKYAKLRGHFRLTNSSLLNLPYKNESFDIIVCLGVLYHMQIKDDESVLREISRLLKKNGIVIITVAAHEFLRSSFDEIECTRHRYAKGEILKKCEKFFSVEKCTFLYSSLLPLAMIQRFIWKVKRPTIETHIKILPSFLNNILTYICSLEVLLLKYITSLPFGLNIFLKARKVDL